MNMKAAGIGSIIIVVMLVIVAIVVTAGDGIWPTPWEEGDISGSWGQEIIIEYADGTTGSLKLACDAPLSIWSGDREIRGIYYILKAKAEGIGYSNIAYDITGFGYTYEATYGSNTNTWSVSCIGYSLADRPVDGQWHQLIRHYTSADDIIPNTFPPGEYTITVSSVGYICFSADGEPQVCLLSTDLPDTISFTLLVKQDKSISVSFSSGYEVFE